MASPPQPAHASYWNLNDGCCIAVADIARPGPTYLKDGPVRHAWQTICLVYFTETSTPPGTPMYVVDRESQANRAKPLNQVPQRPDVAVVRITDVTQRPGRPPSAVWRDCLWVECKGPDQDKPSGWSNLMDEAVVRLNLAHPERMVYLILGIGLKWMVFRWDPTVPAANPPLQVFDFEQTRSWVVDPRIHLLTSDEQHPLVQQASQYIRCVSTGQTVIDISRAHTLEYWTLNASGVPENLTSMMFLESCLSFIGQSIFPGQNPLDY